MWKEIKCNKCDGTGKITESNYIFEESNYNISQSQVNCYICNGYGNLKQKCFGTELKKIKKIKKRTKCSRFEIMEI